MPDVPGSNGTWTYTITPGMDGAGHHVGPDTIDIDFNPDAGAGHGCTNIRLIQTLWVRGLDAAGKVVGTDDEDLYTDPHDNPFGWARADGTLKKVGDRYYRLRVDHVKCEGDPFYNGDDAPQDDSSRGDSTTMPPTGTRMSDTPRRNFGNKKPEVATIGMNFETCAVCAETGECLGCITWTSTATRAPFHAGKVAVTSASDAPCSSEFKQAVKVFLSRHGASRDAAGNLHWYCPEDGTTRGAIPRDFERRTLTGALALAPAKFGMAPNLGGSMRKLALRRDRADGSQLSGDAMAVIRQCVDRPTESAIKFTWLGSQSKTVASIVLSPRDIQPSDLEHVIPDLNVFSNDLALLYHQRIPDEVMRGICSMLGEYVPRQSEEGDLAITVVAFDGEGAGVGYVARHRPNVLPELLRAAVTGLELDPETVAALNYLSLNMGGGELLRETPL